MAGLIYELLRQLCFSTTYSMYMITPIAQMSHISLYVLLSMISGATYETETVNTVSL